MRTTLFKRTRRPGATRGRLGWWERSMFSFMGPPQLGDHRAPEGYAPDPQANVCHRCGQSYDVHERVHTGSMTYRRCPTSRA